MRSLDLPDARLRAAAGPFGDEVRQTRSTSTSRPSSKPRRQGHAEGGAARSRSAALARWPRTLGKARSTDVFTRDGVVVTARSLVWAGVCGLASLIALGAVHAQQG